MTSSRTGTFDC